jgi:hypothetical protein
MLACLILAPVRGANCVLRHHNEPYRHYNALRIAPIGQDDAGWHKAGSPHAGSLRRYANGHRDAIIDRRFRQNTTPLFSVLSLPLVGAASRRLGDIVR